MRKRTRINGQLYEQVPQSRLNKRYSNTYNERLNVDAPIFSEVYPETTLRSKKKSLDIIGRARIELFTNSRFDPSYYVEPIEDLSAKELLNRFYMPAPKDRNGKRCYSLDIEQVARL